MILINVALVNNGNIIRAVVYVYKVERIEVNKFSRVYKRKIR